MIRHPRTISFALVCLTAAGGAQTGSQFKPVSFLPPDTQFDEYSITGDGNRVYYTTPKGEVMLYDRKTQKTTRISEGGDIWDITVARNGSAVAYTRLGESNKDEFIWTIPLDPATGLAKGPQRRASMIAGDAASLSQDGRFLAFARDDSGSQTLVVLPTLGGPERIFGSYRGGIGTIRWTPDSKTVFLGANSNRQNPPDGASIERVSLDGGSLTLVASTTHAWPGLSPDGSLIAFADSGSTRSVVIADATGRRLGNVLTPVGFHLDPWLNGTTLVASRSTNPFRAHVYNVATGTSHVLVDSLDDAAWPMWSPSGKQILFGRSPAGFRDLILVNGDGSSARAIRVERQFGHSLAWSPDGRWAIYSTNGLPTTAVAVEVATGKQVSLGTSSRDIFVRWSDNSHAILKITAQNGAGQSQFLREVGLSGASRRRVADPIRRGLPDLSARSKVSARAPRN